MNLTIHCPKCKHTHEVGCESVWDERGLLMKFLESKSGIWLHKTTEDERVFAIRTFLKERG